MGDEQDKLVEMQRQLDAVEEDIDTLVSRESGDHGRNGYEKLIGFALAALVFSNLIWVMLCYNVTHDAKDTGTSMNEIRYMIESHTASRRAVPVAVDMHP